MILDTIEGPADLRRLTLKELGELAAEIRQVLIVTVMNNGGHLASNLGVVELTLALHRVFQSPRDKILWDVGHQSYVHKLLTGRRERFATIRQYGGLSGFPEPGESPHDAFGMGHASTSISAALGMALARDLSGEDYHVVAVIGDGALAGGMAFEALNHAGHLGKRLIVILNDNAMAISPSVGALAKWLGRLRLDPRYSWAKQEAVQVFRHLPLGKQVTEVGKRVKEGMKGLLLPTMIWEGLGFKYLGPVNGHNLAELEEVLSDARRYSAKPVFVHVITRKGKGYEPAEKDAVGFHGVPPVKAEEKAAPSYSEVFAQTLGRLAGENPRIVAITAAMSEGTGLSSLRKEFPDRVFDVGICEQHAVTFAAGLASQGFIPIVAIYSTFLQRAYDQVIHDVCIQNLPVVFVLDRAGIVGEDGRTHQGAFDLSFLGCIPNMVIASPKDENELQHLLYTAVKAKGPVALRYPRGSGLGVPLDAELKDIPIGKGEVVRLGKDVALVALGSTVAPSLEAAQALAQKGVDCTVVNARFAKPLDSSLLLEVAKGKRLVVTVEENALAGGFGSAVVRLLAGLPIPVEGIGLPEEFIEHGPQELFRARYDLDSKGIERRILAALGRKASD